MAGLSLLNFLTLLVIIVAFLFLLINYYRHLSRPYARLRKVSSFVALPGLIHAAGERGDCVELALGSQLSSAFPNLSAGNGLALLPYLNSHFVFSGKAGRVSSGDGHLYCVSRMLIQGVYQDALAPELFKAEQNVYGGATPAAYVGEFMGGLQSSATAALLLSGAFSADLLPALDLAARDGISTYSFSTSLSAQMSAFLFPCSLVLGEDVYAPAAHLAASPLAAASLRAQDYLRLLLVAGLLLGIVLKLCGVWP